MVRFDGLHRSARTVRETMHRAFQDDEDDAGPVSLRLAPRRAGLRLAGRGILALGIIAVLSVYAHRIALTQPARDVEPVSTDVAFVPSAAVPARPAIPHAASGPRYRLDDPDALDPPRSEPGRIDPATGRREDTLTQGTFETIDSPYLRVTIGEASFGEANPSLFVSLVRRAAVGSGLSIERTGERGRIGTKFGPVETLEATLAGSGRRVCAGFVTVGDSSVRIDGWLCAPLGQPPEPRAIVCALDKIVVDGRAEPFADGAARRFEAARDPGCRPLTPSAGQAAETGSIERRSRKNEGRSRQTAQARP